MPRQTVHLPQPFIFTCDHEVQVGDVNFVDHLGADRILPIAIEAQLAFSRHLGHDLLEPDRELGMIMAHSETCYLSEALLGHALRINLGVDNLNAGKSFRIGYRIDNLSTAAVLAELVTTMLFFDYRERRVVPIPDDFRDRVLALQP